MIIYSFFFYYRRQNNRKRRPFAYLTLYLYSPFVVRDYLVAYGQAKACAFLALFSGKEGLKHMRQVFFWDTATCVSEFYSNSLRCMGGFIQDVLTGYLKFSSLRHGLLGI